MQNPDKAGFVNVVWPSNNVPHGGIFHVRKSEPTAEQQQFLKVLLQESKFNLKLRQTRGFGLRLGDEVKAPVSAVSSRAAPSTVRPHTSRRRSLSAIRSSGVLDVDTFRPLKKGEDRERMKDKLANTMAYGDSLDQQSPPPPKPRQKPAPKLPTAKETWNDLVTQIRERAEWLAEMEYLGHAAPHREIIQDQIAERMRALDALGVDSVCSTARSTVHSPPSAVPKESAKHSVVSESSIKNTASTQEFKKKPYVPLSQKKKKSEENVMAYSHAQLSPLRYSPRRRQ